MLQRADASACRLRPRADRPAVYRHDAACLLTAVPTSVGRRKHEMPREQVDELGTSSRLVRLIDAFAN